MDNILEMYFPKNDSTVTAISKNLQALSSLVLFLIDLILPIIYPG